MVFIGRLRSQVPPLACKRDGECRPFPPHRENAACDNVLHAAMIVARSWRDRHRDKILEANRQAQARRDDCGDL
jgi:hypothetical protein